MTISIVPGVCKVGGGLDFGEEEDKGEEEEVDCECGGGSHSGFFDAVLRLCGCFFGLWQELEGWTVYAEWLGLDEGVVSGSWGGHGISPKKPDRYVKNSFWFPQDGWWRDLL